MDNSKEKIKMNVHFVLKDCPLFQGEWLLFVLFTFPFNFDGKLSLQSAFLGATFVGMSDSGKMSERRLFLAALVYALLYYFVLPFNIGLGGALGFAAFLSCLFVQFLRESLFKALRVKRN